MKIGDLVQLKEGYFIPQAKSVVERGEPILLLNIKRIFGHKYLDLLTFSGHRFELRAFKAELFNENR